MALAVLLIIGVLGSCAMETTAQDDVYELRENSWCSPERLNQTLRDSTLSEAKQQCSDDPTCTMFYDEERQGNTFYNCGEGSVIKASGLGSLLYIKPIRAPCCTGWDAECYTVSNENSNNHGCVQCGGDPCYDDCSSDASSNACKDCCIAAVHYEPWNCRACPCQNGGYCTGADLDNDGQEDCDCTAAVGFEGALCEVNTANKVLEEELEKCSRKTSGICAMLDCSRPKAGLLCPGKCWSCKNYKGRDWCLKKKRAGECDHEWVNLRCRATCAKCCGNVYSESTCAKLTHGVTGSKRCQFSTTIRNNCRRSCGLCGKKADSE